MTLDEVIAALLEAKEHCVDGKSKVLIQRGIIEYPGYITGIEYNSNNVTIKYE